MFVILSFEGDLGLSTTTTTTTTKVLLQPVVDPKRGSRYAHPLPQPVSIPSPLLSACRSPAITNQDK